MSYLAKDKPFDVHFTIWTVHYPAVIPEIIAQKVLYDWLTYSNFSEILLYMAACMDLCVVVATSQNPHYLVIYRIKFNPTTFIFNAKMLFYVLS